MLDVTRVDGHLRKSAQAERDERLLELLPSIEKGMSELGEGLARCANLQHVFLDLWPGLWRGCMSAAAVSNLCTGLRLCVLQSVTLDFRGLERVKLLVGCNRITEPIA